LLQNTSANRAKPYVLGGNDKGGNSNEQKGGTMTPATAKLYPDGD